MRREELILLIKLEHIFEMISFVLFIQNRFKENHKINKTSHYARKNKKRMQKRQLYNNISGHSVF